MANNKEIRDKQICSMYKQNKLVGEIAKELSIDRHTVTRVLKKYEIYDERKAKNRLNQDKINRNEKIIKLYKAGMSFRDIAKEINIGHTTVEYTVHNYIDNTPTQYSIDIEKDNLIRHRKYNLNEKFFEVIDTEEKAYWLGFLYADGCITSKCVKIELQANDKEHINKFLTAIEAYDKKLRYRKDVNSYQAYVNSVKMVNDLQRLGCTAKKTFTLRFPTVNQVPKKMQHHFMRGYFDGDGCVYLRNNINGVNRFTVVGNINFITEYKNILFDNIDKKNNVLFENTSSQKIKTLALGGNSQLNKIYKFLYKNATIYLNRKKEKFEMINGRLKTSSQKS
mgnify:CR=1 FL=1